MNFTIMSRNSVAGTAYTDRPSYPTCSVPEPWKNPHKQHPHLNPSKSKVNVRSSLNKSGEGFSLSNPNLDNVRGSCISGNPPKASHHFSRQSLFDEKYAKSGKQNHDMSFQVNTKESFIKFSNMNRTYLFEPEERKKSDSVFLRSSLKESVIPKFQGESSDQKENASIQDLRASIVALTRRVFMNEQDISKLKDKKDKDKKLQTLEHEFTQFQIQMFDICKKNTNYFSEFQDKIDKNNRQINEIKDRLLFNPEKEQEKEDLNRKIHHCQAKLNEIQDKIRSNEDFPQKTMTTQLSIEQNNMKNYVNEQMNSLKQRLDKQTFENNEIMMKIGKLERDFLDSKFEEHSYKRDNRICGNAIIIERKETMTIKNNEYSRQKIKIGSSTPNKEIRDQIVKDKREILIKQNIYYIDSQGYLLDENKYYLLNSKNEHILIPEHLLLALRNNNMLVPPGKTYQY